MAYQSPYASPYKIPTANTRYGQLSQRQQNRVDRIQSGALTPKKQGPLWQIAQRRAARETAAPTTPATPTTPTTPTVPGSRLKYGNMTPQRQERVDFLLTHPGKLAARLEKNPDKPILNFAKQRLENQGGALPSTVENLIQRMYGTIDNPEQEVETIGSTITEVKGKKGRPGKNKKY